MVVSRMRKGIEKGTGFALAVFFGTLALMAWFNYIDRRTLESVNPAALRNCARFVAEGGEWSQPKLCR